MPPSLAPGVVAAPPGSAPLDGPSLDSAPRPGRADARKPGGRWLSAVQALPGERTLLRGPREDVEVQDELADLLFELLDVLVLERSLRTGAERSLES